MYKSSDFELDHQNLPAFTTFMTLLDPIYKYSRYYLVFQGHSMSPSFFLVVFAVIRRVMICLITPHA